MKKSDSIRTASSIMWLGFSVVANYIITFFLTQYITERIGAEAYGFVSLARTCVNYISILTIALNSFVGRYVSIAYHRNNIKEANKYFSSVFIVDLVLAATFAIVLSPVILNLQHIISIPDDITNSVKVLFIYISMSFLLNTAVTVYSIAPVVNNRMDVQGKFKFVSYVIEAVFLLVIFTILPTNVGYVGMGSFVATTVVSIGYIVYSRKSLPVLKYDQKLFSYSMIKELLVKGMWNSINSIGNILNTGFDLLVANAMLSSTAMGMLAIVKTISSIFTTAFSTISQPFQPKMLKAYAENNLNKVIYILKVNVKLCGLISNILFAGFLALGTTYYSLWVPSQNASFLHTLTIITITGSIIEGAVYPIYYVYTLTLNNKIPCIVTVISGITNILAKVVLLHFTNLDLYAVVITTTLVTWIINFIFNPLYAAQCLGVKKTIFYPVILRHIGSCGVMCIVFVAISKIVAPTSWLGLIVIALLCSVFGVIIHGLIVLEKADTRKLATMLKQKG